MQEVLSEASMTVKLMEASASLDEGHVNLLIVDLDSGLAQSRIELLLQVCIASQTPVLLLGLGESDGRVAAFLSSRGLAKDKLNSGWLRRPFTGAALVHHCRQLLGLGSESSVPFVADGDELRPPAFTARFDTDEPPTVELGPDYHHTVGDGLESARDYEELLNFEIEEFASDAARGGVVVGGISERRIDGDELEREIGYLAEPPSLLRITSSDGFLLSETLAEVSSSGVFTGESNGNIAHRSVSVVSRHRLGGGHSSVSAAGLSPEVVESIVGTARMLAESWDRLGLAARTEDRADRLERILFALFKDGVQGAAATLSRIPSASGLSGSLQVLGLMELLHMLRERSLRGRLELCVGTQVFVLYIDGGVLEDIESLGGSTDAILLRILHEQSAIDDATYGRLAAIDSGDDGLAAPLEMRLRIERLVDDADLRAARRLRARELFRGLFSDERGNYAFIETLQGSKQVWPADGLRLNIDEMLLRLLREGQNGPKELEVDSSEGLILDPVRALSVRASALTDSERELLLFFQAGETVGDARKQFGNAGEDVDQVLARLIRIELLKPHKVETRRVMNRRTVVSTSQVAAIEGMSSSRIELDFDLNALVAPIHDPHDTPTAVSDWAISIPEMVTGDGPISEAIDSIDDGLWDAMDVFFEHEVMSEVSSELLPDTGELDQRIFGAGEQDDES